MPALSRQCRGSIASVVGTLHAPMLVYIPQDRDMRSPRSNRDRASASARRIPLTITLSADHLEFIESCVSLKEFNSVDQLFDAALSVYRKHVQAVNAYADEQSHKGYSRAEILASIECETVVTRTTELSSSRAARRRV
jgi:hypothetical protein